MITASGQDRRGRRLSATKLSQVEAGWNLWSSEKAELDANRAAIALKLASRKLVLTSVRQAKNGNYFMTIFPQPDPLDLES